MEDASGQVKLPPSTVTTEEAEPSLTETLHAIKSCKNSINEMFVQLKTVREELSLVRHYLQKVRERTTALEGRVSLLEDDLNPMKQEIANYQTKIDEMDNRMRGKNIRIVGLPERSEGSDPTVFL